MSTLGDVGGEGASAEKQRYQQKGSHTTILLLETAFCGARLLLSRKVTIANSRYKVTMADEGFVDERFDARYPASLDVLLLSLTDPSRVCRGRMADISKSGLSLLLPIQFGPGDLVKVDFADSSLFGYVVHSGPQDGAFRTGVE